MKMEKNSIEELYMSYATKGYKTHNKEHETMKSFRKKNSANISIKTDC